LKQDAPEECLFSSAGQTLPHRRKSQLEVFQLNGSWQNNALVLTRDDGSLFGAIITDDKGYQTLKVIEEALLLLCL
jgi:hypothetical protein